MQIFANKKFNNPIKIIQAFDNKGFIEAFEEIEAFKKTHYLIGYIRYEAKDVFLKKNIKSNSPLLYFEVYEGYKKYTPGKASDFRLEKRSGIDFEVYKKAISRIKKEIKSGNTYQVNYTYDWKINSDMSAMELYESLLSNQTTPYNAFIKNEFDEILSFSPELFFEIENNIIRTKPMKGTVKRGTTEEEDKKNVEFLKNDTKNRAENVMIVDLLRNDLGKIAKTGSVKADKLFDVETHKTVHQMTSEVTAELKDGVTLYEIFEAIFPCGSITGAPKINTMKIIEELEVGKREIYCGAIGLISPEKTVFSVPIRILHREQGQKPYICRVGGAIVWDSTAKDEWQETLTKIQFLNAPHCNCEEESDLKLIETMLVEGNKIIFQNEHLNRLKKSAKELDFKFNPEILKIQPEQDGILRILLSKCGKFETQDLPLEPTKTNKITVSKTPVNSKEPLLYHKTTHRPWYLEAMEKIKNGEIYDEIFLNEKGELTEGARSNLVLQLGGKMFTPPVECGLLKGIFRDKMLKAKIKYPSPHPSPARGEGANLIKTKTLSIEDLKKAEKIYCVNSVRGVVEVEVDFS